jgi:DNA polymerase-1
MPLLNYKIKEKRLCSMRLLAIDGNSIVNRAFYGIRPLSGPDGTPTNAIYGFLSMVSRLKNEIKPDAVAVAFDMHSPTFRHDMYDEYKAGRRETPDDLTKQIAILKDLLRDFSIPVIECEHYEADDILGTLASHCKKTGNECFIYTGDKDSLQLVDDCVTVYLPHTKPGGTETLVYNKSKVANDFGGLTPKQLIDVKALQGDNSDNIPGVRGIGPKMAISLIAKYGSLESLYNSIERVPEKGKLQEKLMDGKHSAFFSQTLGTICCDVPIQCSLDDLRPARPNQNTVMSDLEWLGLNRFIKEWNIEREEVGIEI